ncbi:MAG: putative photosynthetic complex assembly protein PuhE [Halieaceae bacterium]|nr:putative photosynthetic complex assembly protein PuhE [Halieaceae bacterium]
MLALVVTVFGWWFTTGLILYLNHLPTRTHRWSMLAATGLLLVALVTLNPVAAETTRSAALVAFLQALLLWGWLEMGYLMGFVTGPSNRPCPPDATGWTRFGLALKTSLYHELSVVTLVLVTIAVTAGQPNQVTALTCVSLWLMRWSAKLNLFLGVANFHADWLPRSQQHLVSYMKQRRINLLFPFSVVLGTGFAVMFLHRALLAADPFAVTGSAMVGLLLSLGVLEHWFLVLPIQDSKLWQWAMPKEPDSRRAEIADGLAAQPVMQASHWQ